MNLNFLYSNPDENTPQNETDAIVASEYYGKNYEIKRLQRVLQKLEKRRIRKLENEKIKKALQLENDGKQEEALKLLDTKIKSQKLNLGQLVFSVKENAWYFFSVSGNEKFRIPEPENGIEELFEVEYKRVKV